MKNLNDEERTLYPAELVKQNRMANDEIIIDE